MADVAVPGAPEVAAPSGDGAPAAAARHDFEIIPLRGLPIVAVVFGVLIWAIAANELRPLEFLHVGFGAAWMALDLFLGFVIGPILRRMSVPARIEFSTRLMPKMALIMPVLVTVTLASGWQLGILLGTLDSSYVNHEWIVASYVIVGVMAVIALGLLEPANIAVLFELKKERPDPAVIGHLMKRFIYTAAILGAMQFATLVVMVKIAVG